MVSYINTELSFAVGRSIRDFPEALHVPVHSERDDHVHPDRQGGDHE
jgi:hypothetical protein